MASTASGCSCNKWVHLQQVGAADQWIRNTTDTVQAKRARIHDTSTFNRTIIPTQKKGVCRFNTPTLRVEHSEFERGSCLLVQGPYILLCISKVAAKGQRKLHITPDG